ncbi:hypothetical protein D3C78_1123650 [compost metagenome]
MIPLCTCNRSPEELPITLILSRNIAERCGYITNASIDQRLILSPIECDACIRTTKTWALDKTVQDPLQGELLIGKAILAFDSVASPCLPRQPPRHIGCRLDIDIPTFFLVQADNDVTTTFDLLNLLRSIPPVVIDNNVLCFEFAVRLMVSAEVRGAAMCACLAEPGQCTTLGAP